ncbi:hypothetical protein K439DRAFT_1660837 [Ramaria rubella]|nr:hypothetical protein K439DRAFT_1660837 [Ramaria rubella]
MPLPVRFFLPLNLPQCPESQLPWDPNFDFHAGYGGGASYHAETSLYHDPTIPINLSITSQRNPCLDHAQDSRRLEYTSIADASDRCDIKSVDNSCASIDSQRFSRQPVQHVWTQASNATIPRVIDLLVIEVIDNGKKIFYCGWNGCKHSLGFVRKIQLVTHIRSVHLYEKPFVCTTCDASFTRRQDAIRHVDTMNSGKQYRCATCEEGFARKDYRDRHMERCRFK